MSAGRLFSWWTEFLLHRTEHLHDRNISANENRQLVLFTRPTVYPKKYAHGFVVLCFVVVMQSFIMNSHDSQFHIHLGCFAGTGAIVRLPQCQWSKPDGYGKISQCITTTKHSEAKTVCIFLMIYCINTYICILNWVALRCSNNRLVISEIVELKLTQNGNIALSMFTTIHIPSESINQQIFIKKEIMSYKVFLNTRLNLQLVPMICNFSCS